MNALDSFELLRTQSLSGLVQEALEQQIVASDLKSGDRLREGAIASAMGISCGPVREAFRMLEASGLVDFAKNCGVQVRKLDGEQATQIYQVRIPLEGLIGELAAHRNVVETDAVLAPIMANMNEVVNRQAVGRPCVRGVSQSLGWPVDLLVRSQHNRVMPDGTPLWDQVQATDSVGENSLQHGRAPGSRRPLRLTC